MKQLSLALWLAIWFFGNSLSGLQAQTSGFQNMSVSLNGKWYDLTYKIYPGPPGGEKIVKTHLVTFHVMLLTEDDSLLKSTFEGKPIVKEVSQEQYTYADKGFMEDMLLKLGEGDSAVFMVQSEDVYDAIKRKPPPFLKEGSKVKYIIKVLEVRSFDELQLDIKQAIHNQRQIDEKKIAKYVAQHREDGDWKKTYSGVWYHLEQGEGERIIQNDVVRINFVGKFMDGTIFNSSEKEGRPFEFPVGGEVAIKGLDEVLLLMQVGGKGTFVMPSYLCYGAEGIGDYMPPNSILIFEVELTDIVSRKIIVESSKPTKELSEEEKAKLEAKRKKEKEEILRKQEEEAERKLKELSGEGD